MPFPSLATREKKGTPSNYQFECYRYLCRNVKKEEEASLKIFAYYTLYGDDENGKRARKTPFFIAACCHWCKMVKITIISSHETCFFSLFFGSQHKKSSVDRKNP